MRIANKRGRIPEFPAWNEPPLPPYRLMGRFIGKIGLEVMASRVLKVDGWNDELVDKPELDELRSFVRFNKGLDWPFWHRALYDSDIVSRGLGLDGDSKGLGAGLEDHAARRRGLEEGLQLGCG